MWKPKAIAISGGGMKGFALPSALQVLDTWGYLDELKTFVGTSIGGLASALLALGYKPSEMVTMFDNTLITEFMKQVKASTLLQSGAAASSDWLQQYILMTIGKKFQGQELTLTLSQLKAVTGNRLLVTTLAKKKGGSSLDARLWILTPETHPDLTVWKVILMTTALPGLQLPVEIDGYECEDGGSLDNYPISYTDPKETLGIYLGKRYTGATSDPSISPPTVPLPPPEAEKAASTASPLLQGVTNLLDRLQVTLAVMVNELDFLRNRGIVIKEFCIDVGDIKTFALQWTPELKQRLFSAGLRAAMDFVTTSPGASAGSFQE